MRWATPQAYEKHKAYNLRVRREKSDEKRRLRLTAEGKCVRCEVIRKYDGGDNHRCT